VTDDAVQRHRLTALAKLHQQQAASLAYFDVFWLCAILGVALAFLVLLMKRSSAEKGAHIGAE
jgi:DHA2 family multidrug resistance protein